jgi:hypothetical protein
VPFRFKNFILLTLTCVLCVSAAFAQATPTPTPPTATPTPTPTATPKATPTPKGGASLNLTAEQVAESVIIIYGGFGGRETLNQIRKTTFERGKITLNNADGKVERANYERWIMRGDSLDKERIRFNQEFANARFALIYNNDKIFGIFNDQIFTPTDDASKKFESQIWHGIEALLRYKENGALLALDGKEKILGVEFYRLDVTDKQNRKTRFFVSTKYFKVMMLEYTEDNVKYRRKFYDYNYIQATLVFFRTVLWADDKQVEETEIGIMSFGQKIDETIFQGS